jgi:hypothetical protein
MANTKATRVYRKGATASDDQWVDEDTACHITVDRIATVNIQTEISSKGGGTTCLWIEIGKDDLCSLLMKVAEKHPEIAPVLIEALAKATEVNAKIASERKKHLENIINSHDAICEATNYVEENYYDELGNERPRENKLSEDLRTTIDKYNDAYDFEIRNGSRER